MKKAQGWTLRICLLLLAATAVFAQSADNAASAVVPRLVKFKGGHRRRYLCSI